MSETSGVDSVLLSAARCLESIARDVESVDACAPILCGIAANRLYALLGVSAGELPDITDHPQTIGRLLDCVTTELSELSANPVVSEAVSLVGAARRHLEES
ncbi:hypothetical protein [Jatrophihabitans endophyticus]|uniref:hypothetical protein n=1 Tax=Jatrophihabitans endophyticus TaxID=1206085 RepID=UPI00093311C7|nr:hypothetical protein [Jatrophihabitans endophyticus]